MFASLEASSDQQGDKYFELTDDLDIYIATLEDQRTMMGKDRVIIPSEGTAYAEIKPPPPRPEQKATRVQVITDIDDTVSTIGGWKYVDCFSICI